MGAGSNPAGFTKRRHMQSDLFYHDCTQCVRVTLPPRIISRVTVPGTLGFNIGVVRKDSVFTTISTFPRVKREHTS